MYQFIIRIKNFLQKIYLDGIRYFTNTNLLNTPQVTAPASQVLLNASKLLLEESNPISSTQIKLTKKKKINKSIKAWVKRIKKKRDPSF